MSDLKIKTNYLTNNDCYRYAQICNKMGIQIHTIGTAQGTAASVASYWNQPEVEACVHYICDADVPGNVLQLLPETYRSWADAGWGNNNLITIEICESDYICYTGGASYTVQNAAKFQADILRGYNTAVQLCAKICKERGWDPLAKLSNGMHLISSHNEGRLAGLSSAHVDPDHVWGRFGLTMSGFRKDVKAAMNGGQNAQLYYVRKTWEDKTTQTGAYKSLEGAKAALKPGYSVFDSSGKKVAGMAVFAPGKKYQMLRDLELRKEPRGRGEKVLFSEIPASRRKYFKKGKSGEALIKKGTKDKCLEEYQVGTRGVYMRITRGWILAQYQGRDRVKKV